MACLARSAMCYPAAASRTRGNEPLAKASHASDHATIAPLGDPVSRPKVTATTHTLPFDKLSSKLLLAIAGRIGDRADQIARLCGNLPLVLRVAAGALAERPNLPPADYARRLTDAKQRLSHLKEVEVALNLSYEMLNEEQRRLWRGQAQTE